MSRCPKRSPQPALTWRLSAAEVHMDLRTGPLGVGASEEALPSPRWRGAERYSFRQSGTRPQDAKKQQDDRAARDLAHHRGFYGKCIGLDVDDGAQRYALRVWKVQTRDHAVTCDFSTRRVGILTGVSDVRAASCRRNAERNAPVLMEGSPDSLLKN